MNRKKRTHLCGEGGQAFADKIREATRLSLAKGKSGNRGSPVRAAVDTGTRVSQAMLSRHWRVQFDLVTLDDRDSFRFEPLPL